MEENPYLTQDFMLAVYLVYRGILAGKAEDSLVLGVSGPREGAARFLFLPYAEYSAWAQDFEDSAEKVYISMHCMAWRRAKTYLSRFKKEGPWTQGS